MKSNAENVYFFDADIIENVPWEDVQQNNTGLLERRKIDLEYCKKMVGKSSIHNFEDQ
jgi:hypothetical protein